MCPVHNSSWPLAVIKTLWTPFLEICRAAFPFAVCQHSVAKGAHQSCYSSFVYPMNTDDSCSFGECELTSCVPMGVVFPKILTVSVDDTFVVTSDVCSNLCVFIDTYIKKERKKQFEWNVSRKLYTLLKMAGCSVGINYTCYRLKILNIMWRERKCLN